MKTSISLEGAKIKVEEAIGILARCKDRDVVNKHIIALNRENAALEISIMAAKSREKTR